MSFSVAVLGGLVLACLILALVRPEWRFALWVAIILGCVVPWVGWQDHSHWDGVNWVPFSTAIADVKPLDLFANFVLYLPFGFLLVRHHVKGGVGVVVALVGACCLSLATEGAQVYSHGRFPSMTDVVMNSIGGMAGAIYGRSSSRGPAR